MENKLYLKIRFIKVKLSFPSAKRRLINLYKRYIELAYFLFAIRLHCRKQQHISYRSAVGQQHNESIQSHSQPACGRETVFQSRNKVLVHLCVCTARFSSLFNLLYKALFLINRIVQL